MSHNTTIRSFYPGDKWLYYKLYGGVKSCDFILPIYILPMMNRLKRMHLISKWFYIRYSDPDFHIRLRIELTSNIYFADVIHYIAKDIIKLCNAKMLYDYSINTYRREIERYGINAIYLTENIFYIDSELIINILKKIRRCNGNIRWEIGLYLVDRYLNCFGYSDSKKLEIIGKMSESYHKEFGFNEHNMKPLNSMYRELRPIINNILSDKSEDTIWINIASMMQKCCKEIVKLDGYKELYIHLNISSLIHMTINRLFASKNRLYELIIYDFLTRYYKSKIAIAQINYEKD